MAAAVTVAVVVLLVAWSASNDPGGSPAAPDPPWSVLEARALGSCTVDDLTAAEGDNIDRGVSLVRREVFVVRGVRVCGDNARGVLVLEGSRPRNTTTTTPFGG